MCDSQKDKCNSSTKSEYSPSELELKNVHKVYNEIANHFSETRHSPWPHVEEFVCSFPDGSVLVDIGCGNGKYLGLNPSIAKVSSSIQIHNNYKTKNFKLILDRM